MWFWPSRERRVLRGFKKRARGVDKLPDLGDISDQELKDRAQAISKRLKDHRHEVLGDATERDAQPSKWAALKRVEDAAAPEVFALVREAGRRTLQLRHFDSQLIGGMALHDGMIAEMATGEGKTLVATLPASLNALAGRHVYLVTVNDYLARRDAEWMRPIYEALGLTVGVIVSALSTEQRQAQYACDIVYATNNELGFDYLRDNMAFSLENMVQGPLDYAIVDEVDSILIDEARTPLIISGPTEHTPDLYRAINRLVPKFHRQQTQDSFDEQVEAEERGDFWIDEKNRNVDLTESGHETAERLLAKEGMLAADDSLYDPANLKLVSYLNAALRAHHVYKRDIHYLVRDGEVVLVDEHTGRALPGRRLSEGLHQALEVKENVTIRAESQTLASITYQNLFRLFAKLAGMTGTAFTEREEFEQIYGLDVIRIPTNKPMVRVDEDDVVFFSEKEKFDAVIDTIIDLSKKSIPVLVGTTSVDTSERMSRDLLKAGVKHRVLNARKHQQEAEIIAQAGRPGAVTIATNMAGRGTDIVLGGNLEVELAAAPAETHDEIRKDWEDRHQQVIDAGGLHVLGTERHESRRIDNQLRGRSGRQGDPGCTQFFLSFDDALMRLFAGERLKRFMRNLQREPGEMISARPLTRSIQGAQRRMESHHFDIRKQLLEFDEVPNQQRTVIYAQRRELLQIDDVRDVLFGMTREAVSDLVMQFIDIRIPHEEWNVDGLVQALRIECNVTDDPTELIGTPDTPSELEDVASKISSQLAEHYQQQVEPIGDPMRALEKQMVLQVLDSRWKDHLVGLDQLKRGIHLRAYAQKNPRQEFRSEAFDLFGNMLSQYRSDVVRLMTRIRISRDQVEDRQKALEQEHSRMYRALPSQPAGGGQVTSEGRKGVLPRSRRRSAFIKSPAGAVGGPAAAPAVDPPRNQPCPCGSGRKYKHCHGKAA